MPNQHESHDALFLAYEQAKLELLTVDAKASEMKRRFHADGVTTPIGERQALYAEQDHLRVITQELKIQAMAAKQKARALKGNTFLNVLISKTQEAGLGRLVDEARIASSQAIEDAGLTTAYRA